jgi:hypothetical protein
MSYTKKDWDDAYNLGIGHGRKAARAQALEEDEEQQKRAAALEEWRRQDYAESTP